MADYATKNMMVTHAGYKHIGHFRRGHLEIILESHGCGCAVFPKDEFNMFDLFRVFGIDCEDGSWMSDLVGKYCRVSFDEKGYPVLLQHLIYDHIKWEAPDRRADNG